MKYVPKGMLSKNFCYYFLIASFGRLIDVGILYALTDWAGLFYLLSATLSFIMSQSLNFYLNKTFNFENKSKKVAKQFAVFMLVNSVGLGISLVILALLVEIFSLWYIAARIIAMPIALAFNYTMHRRYTFALFN